MTLSEVVGKVRWARCEVGKVGEVGEVGKVVGEVEMGWKETEI